MTELRKTRWIDSKGRGPAALDPASRLKALGLYPGNEALELIPKIPGICKFEPLGQWFFLENEDRFLVASATWVPSVDRQSQRYEVRKISVKYNTKKSNHTETLRRLCSELTRNIQPASESVAAQCVKEAQDGFVYTSKQGDTYVFISGDSHNHGQIDLTLTRIDEWSEQPMDIDKLSKELSKHPSCKRS